MTVKETVGGKLYSLELDELKKPSDITGGTLNERYHIKEGYNKLLQKIEKARVFLEKVSEKNTRFSVAPDIDTPAFKNWFAESKVVDEDGKPLVVYHGANWNMLEEPAGSISMVTVRVLLDSARNSL